jgi:hypothetical protein
MPCIGIPPYLPANRQLLYGIARFFAVGPRLFAGPMTLTLIDREDALQLYFLVRESLAAVQDMSMSDEISQYRAKRYREVIDSFSFLVHFALSRPEFKDQQGSWQPLFEEVCGYLGTLRDRIDDRPVQSDRFDGARKFYGTLNDWMQKEALTQAREGL